MYSDIASYSLLLLQITLLIVIKVVARLGVVLDDRLAAVHFRDLRARRRVVGVLVVANAKEAREAQRHSL